MSDKLFTSVPAGLIASLVLCLPAPALAGNLVVNVENLRNAQGVVRCGLFAGEDGWRQEERAQHKTVSKISEQRGAVCDFGDVRDGQYAVAVFHAENREEKIEYGLFGKPRQGVGFSNNPSMTFGPPDYDAARVTVGPGPTRLRIQVKY